MLDQKCQRRLGIDGKRLEPKELQSKNDGEFEEGAVIDYAEADVKYSQQIFNYFLIQIQNLIVSIDIDRLENRTQREHAELHHDFSLFEIGYVLEDQIQNQRSCI